MGATSRPGAQARWNAIGRSGALRAAGNALTVVGVAASGWFEYEDSIEAGEGQEMAVARGAAGVAGGAAAAATAISVGTVVGGALGSVVPVAGTVVGMAVGAAAGVAVGWAVTEGLSGVQNLITYGAWNSGPSRAIGVASRER